MIKIILTLLLIQSAYLQYQTKKDIDIIEDFTGDVDFRLENVNTAWKKRGILVFSSKNNKNYKSVATINNEPLTQDDIKSIDKECELNGYYMIRVKINGHNYFSSLPAVYDNNLV
jgi:hypothetical protein